MQNELDGLIESKETRTHALTMAVIHLLNLVQKPNSSTTPKPKPSINHRTILRKEQKNTIQEEIKNLFKTLLNQQLEDLDKEYSELLEKLIQLSE